MSGVYVFYDDRVPTGLRISVRKLLEKATWRSGWKSDHRDAFSFFHAHFGGAEVPDHFGGEQYDCVAFLPEPLRLLWTVIQAIMPATEQTLLRCYANLYPYGHEGTVHTDSTRADNWTWIYYPADTWRANWGGETLFFNKEQTEIIGAVYPRPGRLLCFDGMQLHVGRGVTRQCPVSRMTLMFKSSVKSS